VSQTARKASRIEWSSVLRQALAADGRAPSGRSLFHEARADLAVVLGPAERREAVHTHSHGVCLDDPTAPALLTFRSSPCPDDVANLVRGETRTAAEATSPPCDATPEIDADAAIAVTERLRHLACTVLGERSVKAHWVSFVQRVAVARDDGLTAEDTRKGWRVRLDGWLERGGRRVMATVELGRGATPTPDDPRLADLVRSLEERLLARRGTVAAPRGWTTIVLAAGVGGVLAHELFGHALEADTFEAGRSWLADLPAGALPEDLVVVDDPRLCRAPIRFDDEGSEAQATELVANGRIASCLHDRTTSSRLGVRATGHGRRASFRESAQPRMACTYIAPGKVSADALVRDVADGVFVHRMEAGSTNTKTGRSTFRVTDAVRIRGGRTGEAIEPHVLEIEARRVLPAVRVADDLAFDTCIGSCHRDGQTLITSVGAPTVRIGMAGVVR